MTDEDIQKLIQTNQRLLYLIGYASSFLFSVKDHIIDDDKEKFEWFKKAVTATVYCDERWPEVP
jgi:hypothetical protein